MNWYFEQDGVSQGPFTEGELLGRVRAKAVSAETLIWNPSLEAWQSVGELKPEWLKPATVEQPRSAPTPTKSAFSKPVIQAAPESAEAKPSLFKRWFGKKG
jgi:hypothetical protein